MLNSKRKLPLLLVLVLPFVVQVAAVVGVTLWLSLRSGRQAVEEVASRLRTELNQRIWDYLDGYLEVPHRINELNANALELGQLDPRDAEGLGRHFWHQLQEFESVSFIFFGTPQGGAAGAGRIRDGTLVVDTTPVDPELGLIAGTRYEYAVQGAGVRGELLKATEGFDARERPWFQGTVKARRPIWNEVYPFFAEKSLAVAASKPVFRPDGSLLGVLVSEFTLAKVSDFLSRLEVGRTGLTFILERSGGIIASSTGEAPFLAVEGAEQRRLMAADSREPLIGATARFLESRPGGLPEISGIQQLAFELDGEKQYVHVAPLSDPRGIDWLTVVILPESDFTERLEANTRVTLWLCLAALLLAVALGVFTARRITLPILRLRDASRAITDGSLDHPVAGGDIEELEDLAKSFNLMAAQVRTSFAELEGRVEERTAQLRDAKDEADSANQAKTRFLATVSHEIRSPLGAILGYVDLIEDPATPSEEQRRYLHTIRRAGHHLSRLLGDLLDFSRIEAGRLELNERTCELADVLADLTSAFEPQAAEKGLTLRTRVVGWLPWQFVSDPTRLRQILSNLLTNSLRYTEVGEVTLSVVSPGAEVGTEPDASTLCFEVRDTGVGIRPEDQKRLFQRFTQLEPSRRPGAGFGLGLAITQQLVELMEGSIEVASEEGSGSTFTVRIPVTGCAEWAQRESIYLQSPGEVLPIQEMQLSGRVLIADDSEDLLELCRRMLQRWGLETATAVDGRDAVARATHRRFDAILMDWQMPKLDGLEATRELRRLGIRTPIVALTAAALRGDREKCLAAGCTGYLVKPIDFKELFRVLRRLLATPQGNETVPLWLPEPMSPSPSENPEPEADEEILELSRTYLEGLPKRLIDLQVALETADWKTLDAILHRLAGTAGTYGFDEIYQVTVELETVAEGKDAASLRPLLGKLDAAVERASEKLAGTPRGGPGSSPECGAEENNG